MNRLEGMMADTTPANGHHAEPKHDRLPPQHLEAERCFLGCCFLQADAIDDAIELGLRVEDFYRDAHGVLWRAIEANRETGKPVDIMAVEVALRKVGQWENVGGDDFIEQVITSVPHAANAKYYAQIVIETAIRRQLIETSTETIRDVYANELDVTDLAFEAEQRLFGVTERNVGSTVWTGPVLVEECHARQQLRSDGIASGLSTGLIELDGQLGGLKPGQLVIVGARPSMGKTALALHMMDHAAGTAEKNVFFASLEMGRQELGDRLVCMIAGIDSQKFQFARGFTDREQGAISKAYARMHQSAFHIDDASSRNPSQIAAVARRIKRRPGLDLIIVDYMQLMGAAAGGKGWSREQVVAEISKACKRMARDLFVPVVVLCQLNRAVESRDDKKPRMSDLRESGAIEQDADVVLMLHRPEYYDANDQPGIAELVVAKNRNGPTGVVKVQFDRRITRFSNLGHEPSDQTWNDQPF
jgi:replicative DNA helicase